VLGQGERALQVDVDDGIPVLFGQRGDHAVTHDSRVVHDCVEAAPPVDRAGNELAHRVPVRHGRCFGDCLATGRPDLFGDILGGRAPVVALTTQAAARIVDDHACPLAGQFEAVAPAQSSAATGHDDDPSTEQIHVLLLVSLTE
jgi:hypothetical protein